MNYGTNPDHARNTLSNCGVKEPRYGDRRNRLSHTKKKGGIIPPCLSALRHSVAAAPFHLVFPMSFSLCLFLLGFPTSFPSLSTCILFFFLSAVSPCLSHVFFLPFYLHSLFLSLCRFSLSFPRLFPPFLLAFSFSFSLPFLLVFPMSFSSLSTCILFFFLSAVSPCLSHVFFLPFYLHSLFLSLCRFSLSFPCLFPPFLPSFSFSFSLLFLVFPLSFPSLSTCILFFFLSAVSPCLSHVFFLPFYLPSLFLSLCCFSLSFLFFSSLSTCILFFFLSAFLLVFPMSFSLCLFFLPFASFSCAFFLSRNYPSKFILV